MGRQALKTSREWQQQHSDEHGEARTSTEKHGDAWRQEQATKEDHERDTSSTKEANREAIYMQRRGSYPACARSTARGQQRQLETAIRGEERGRRGTGRTVKRPTHSGGAHTPPAL
uniref:Uncharacterized protein n=1 Tax=Knipowitschia caucasica TaxID=637954 RepID=A0AAV2JZC4_KNICA